MVRRSRRVGAVCNTVVKTEWVRIPSPSQITKMRLVPKKKKKVVEHSSSYIKPKIKDRLSFSSH